jgi:hypothetical protein
MRDPWDFEPALEILLRHLERVFRRQQVRCAGIPLRGGVLMYSRLYRSLHDRRRDRRAWQVGQNPAYAAIRRLAHDFVHL